MQLKEIYQSLMEIESGAIGIGSVLAVFQKQNNESAVDLQEYFSAHPKDLLDLLNFLAQKAWTDAPEATEVFFTGLSSSMIPKEQTKSIKHDDGVFLGVLISERAVPTHMISIARNVAGSLKLLRDYAWDIKGGPFFFWYIDQTTPFSLAKMVDDDEWAQNIQHMLLNSKNVKSIFSQKEGKLVSNLPCFTIFCWNKQLLFKLLSSAVLLLRHAGVLVYSQPLMTLKIPLVKDIRK